MQLNCASSGLRSSLTLNCAPWFLFICCILSEIDGSGYMNFVLTGHILSSQFHLLFQDAAG